MLLSFFVLVITFVISFILYDIKKPSKFPPGPPWLPIVGNLPEVKRKRSALGFQHLVWHEYHKRYGPVIGLRLGRVAVVVVSSAQGIREVLTRDEFSGRPDGFFFRLRTFGKRLGIIFTDGCFWQRQRRFFLHHLKQFGYGRREMEDQITEEVIDLVDNLKKRCHELVNVNNLFDISVLNALWAMIAGKRFNLEDQRLRELMDIMHEQFRNTDSSGGLLNQMPFLRFFAPKLSGYSRILQIHERTWAFLRETITEHKLSLCTAGHERDLIDSFLQKMIPPDNSKKAYDVSFNEEQLLSICKDMFMAGSETTSNSLEFLVLYMIKYPEVQKKMQMEMDSVVGKNRWPTLQDRNSLPYLDAVLNETQRCSTVAPMGIPHRSIKDTELMGYHIPKGTTVLTNLYQIHMNPEFWGDPENYRPERFLETGFKQEALDTYFVPFGYGQRRCLGETMAKANLFLVTSALFHNFTVSVPKGYDPPTFKAHDGIALSPLPYEAQFSIRNY